MSMKGYVFFIVVLALVAIVMFAVIGCKSAGTIADYGFGVSVDSPIGEFEVSKEKAEDEEVEE
jgi:hypothetical protein